MLKPEYADLLKRIDLSVETPAEVAEQSGITYNNLMVRLHRARQALRKSLEHTCGACTQHGCLDWVKTSMYVSCGQPHFPALLPAIRFEALRPFVGKNQIFLGSSIGRADVFSSPEILEYHRKLLNLPSPWEVRSVDVDIEKVTVTIDVFWPAQTFVPCPQCQQLCSVKDTKSRMWRHLDTMQFKTYLRGDVPRVDCAEHGALQMFVPWSDPKSRFTAMLEKLAAEILRFCKNQSQATGLLRLSWKQIHRIQELFVAKALALRKQDPIQYLGIDEQRFLKGHRYVTVLCDQGKKRVLDVARGRNEADAQKVLECLSPEQKEAVAMEMWEPFKTIVEKEMPKADIVHDRFHITGYLTKAVDSVRKNEHRQFLKEGIDVLKGTKYLWLTNQSNWDGEQKSRFRELKGTFLTVGRAFSMNETFRDFWTYLYQGPAEKFFNRWYFWAAHSRLKPMIEAARTLKRHLGNILTYFKHRISNSASEGLNAKIQLIKADARGFRNFENFRTEIHFHCRGFKYLPLKWA